MFKNISGQKIQLFAFDSSTNLPKTGDAANITAYVRKDNGSVTVLGDTSGTEASSTNAPGVYDFDLTQAETNADELTFSAKSSTSNIVLITRFITTNPPNFTTMLIDNGGNVAANLAKIIGTALTETVGGYLAAAFKKLFDVVTPVLTSASINQTGDSFARIGAPAGASISADIAGVKTDVGVVKTEVDVILADTGAIYNRIGVPAGASISADIAAIGSGGGGSDIAAIKVQTDKMVFTSAGRLDVNVEAVGDDTDAADRLKAGVNTNGTFTVGSGSTTSTVVTSACDPAGHDANQFVGRFLLFDKLTTTQALRGQGGKITANTASVTPVFTIDNLTVTPAPGDFGIIA